MYLEIICFKSSAKSSAHGMRYNVIPVANNTPKPKRRTKKKAD